jgi:BirA family transcriptional regulator, biotin operon repressor / biotin---[acetyl-CoA-carboxylase] ligase
VKPINNNLLKVTQLLSDGEYHDGTSIGHQLNITRAAVWKLMKKLEQYGAKLTSARGKGYRLESPLVLLSVDKVQVQLKRQQVRLEVLEKINSTNDYLKQHTHQNKQLVACVAEMQTQGRGRLQRSWHSPFAENVYFSLLYPFAKDVSELSGLSLVVGLAICHAIESVVDLSSEPLKVKWPNDVLVDGLKLAGTLIEIQAESNGGCQVIVGVGLNVNMTKASKADIDQPWSSLQHLTGQYIDRNQLCAALIDSLVEYIDKFSIMGMSAFMKEWKSRDYLMGSGIAIASGDKKTIGTCAGVNKQGNLLLKNKLGDVLVFSSGDASLIK